ncbi:MAG TPA: hypothetical protein VGD05_04825 [Pyrinomonadaceae bacterium]
MKVILFLFYYSKLLLSVMFGIHQTLHPLGLKWRWEFWKSKHTARRNHRFSR